MDTEPTAFSGLSHARLTAYAAVLILSGIIFWNVHEKPTVIATGAQTTQNTTDINDDALASLAQASTNETYAGITPLGAAIVADSLKEYERAMNAASSSYGGMLAVQNYGETVKPQVQYRTYAAGDIVTTQETSKDRVLNYRADLRTALEPLLDNKEYELDIFASYVETKDPKHLESLKLAAQNYRLAIANTEKVIAPTDAAVYQASILTAMSRFTATLDALSNNAMDPFASAALMRTFLDAQDNMLTSFNSIAKYSQQKLL